MSRPSACIHSIFERVAADGPDRIAVTGDAGRITYRELNTRADQLAELAIARGVPTAGRVALVVDRSPDMIAAMLAALKAGAAYVPIDPTYPPARIAFILHDAKPALVFTQRSLRDKLPSDSPDPILLDESPERLHSRSGLSRPRPVPDPDAVAYVMYTSGSTGQPKGVCVPHRGVVSLILDRNVLPMSPENGTIQVASPGFDISVLEIFAPLLHGGRVALAGSRLPTLSALARRLRRGEFDTLITTSAFFHVMIDEAPGDFANLRAMTVGGDVISRDHVLRALAALPNTRIVLCYGPTEATIIATCWTPGHADDLRPFDSVPIGHPVAGRTIRILDEHRNPVPPGETGELVCGGIGVAAGYLNRPDLTRERFIPDPFAPDPGARLYRTGDLARSLPGGMFDFRGRIDHQVKIRGFRVEPGEIEAALRTHPAVRDAVVLAPGAGLDERRLVACVIPRQTPDGLSALLAMHLRQTLPPYMIPSGFVSVDRFPLSPNGKIDRSALAQLAELADYRAGHYAPAPMGGVRPA